jgi:RNA polymerase sigma-70 factor, ECF subfamily
MTEAALARALTTSARAECNEADVLALEDALSKVCQRAVTSDPSFDAKAFSTYVGQALAETPSSMLVQELEARLLDEMATAFAASQGSKTAVLQIETIVRSKGPDWARRAGANAEDVIQQVMLRLLLPHEGEPPKILTYRGSAPLRVFLKVVITRAAVSMVRKNLLESSLSVSYEGAAGKDPELDALRQRYGDMFRLALREAVSSLGAAERVLLKLHYKQGVQVAELAKMHNLHRVSMSRRLSEIRERLFSMTKEIFSRTIPATDSEYASLVRLVKSDLDLQLSSLEDDE